MHVPHKSGIAVPGQVLTAGRGRKHWGGSSALPRPGLPGKVAAASTVKRGPEMGEAGKFQRVKVMPRGCGDTSGYLWRRLGMALAGAVISIY